MIDEVVQMPVTFRLAITCVAVLAMFALAAWGGVWYFAGMAAMSACKSLLAWAKAEVPK